MRPNGRLKQVRSQFDRRMKRLVAIATGRIGHCEYFASVTMPRPATREIFGTSAVTITLPPDFSSRSIPVNACSAFLRMNSLPLSPEPRR